MVSTCIAAVLQHGEYFLYTRVHTSVEAECPLTSPVNTRLLALLLCRVVPANK